MAIVTNMYNCRLMWLFLLNCGRIPGYVLVARINRAMPKSKGQHQSLENTGSIALARKNDPRYNVCRLRQNAKNLQK
jgi:hypothetical protein